MHTLDLRDRMTARHSAAVARYAREIAIAAGFSSEEQELVHTAGLMHDIGKFVFPDRILKTDTKLTEEDWQIIKMHPYQGAKVVREMEGYGPVGDIILAHHERFDGKGYPRGLKGNEIPALSRIISVADTYDVMTARDSYRKPVSSFEAIQELRRVSGAQLDAEFVELFIEVLAGKDVKFRHGEDADFDRELGIEKRVHDYSMPLPHVTGEPSLEAAEIAESNGVPDTADTAETAETAETSV
jgi:putative nucleotidyltransferase with HDIG domain